MLLFGKGSTFPAKTEAVRWRYFSKERLLWKISKVKKPFGGVLFYWFEFWRIYKYSYILLKTWERLLLTKKKAVHVTSIQLHLISHSVPNICNNKFISVICATIIVKARILFCNFCQLFIRLFTLFFYWIFNIHSFMFFLKLYEKPSLYVFPRHQYLERSRAYRLRMIIGCKIGLTIRTRLTVEIWD